VPTSTRDRLHIQIIGYLRAHNYASLIDLAQALYPEAFADDDLGSRQSAMEQLREQCARLVEANVLATAYSPSDGELVYCVREVHVQGGIAPGAGAGMASAVPEAVAPAVFRRRGDAGWRASTEAEIGPSPAELGNDLASDRSAYAVFFKLGTVLRPSCDLALRDFAAAAARAAQIHVVGLVSGISSAADMPGLLASQRAAIVANRLVDCGIDRFRIELSVRPWDERPLSKDILAVDPPKSLAAQSRRVDINLRHE
jgi:hypothetical protein